MTTIPRPFGRDHFSLPHNSNYPKSDHVNTQAQGRILLTALTSFIQPVVYTNAASSGTPVHGASVGEDLLLALRKFIEATLSLQDDDHIDINDSIPKKDDDHPMSNEQEIAIPSISIVTHIPEVLQHSTEFPFPILESIRRRVFNVLPIRMLAFEADGSGLQIIERNQIVLHCASNLLKIQNQGGSIDVKQQIESCTNYAILSHIWVHDFPGEVTYKDWNTRHLNKQGNSKIINLCRISAEQYGVTLAWMDTVCINKDSTSELDESIRSMYKWYHSSTICVVHLSPQTRSLETIHRDPWFTRGWTLQELLAPPEINFFTSDWNQIVSAIPWHDKAWAEFEQQIQLATGISLGEFHQFREGKHDAIPISRRLQLAANRKVTREEDLVYSLMGILDVQMEIGYGEGFANAFYRLVRKLVEEKRQFVDIFNCGLFPPSISGNLTSAGPNRVSMISLDSIRRYKGRSAEFDWTSARGHVHTLFDQSIHPQVVPKIRMGFIQISVILVPALRLALSSPNATPNQSQPSIGDFCGTATIAIPTPQHYESPIPATCIEYYSLLHKDLFTGLLWRHASRFWTNGPNQNVLEVVSFGILNFGMEDGSVVLHDKCLAVPLNCGGVVRSVSLLQGNVVGIIPTVEATVFTLQSKVGNYKIPTEELEIHGMQLYTLNM